MTPSAAAAAADVETVDVLIVGAGLSGIGAAHHLQRRCPRHRVAIVEARDASGGTWDLFRYPGVRSDSDMYTLGYSFRPWRRREAIADGASILAYLRETADEAGITPRIRFGLRVRTAAWSTDAACWTVALERTATGEALSLPGARSGPGAGLQGHDARRRAETRHDPRLRQ